MKNNNQNLSKTSYNTTLETSFSLGHSAPDDTNMFVKTVESKSKKDFCIYLLQNGTLKTKSSS